jgi:hypothetical protein
MPGEQEMDYRWANESRGKDGRYLRGSEGLTYVEKWRQQMTFPCGVLMAEGESLPEGTQTHVLRTGPPTLQVTAVRRRARPYLSRGFDAKPRTSSATERHDGRNWTQSGLAPLAASATDGQA